MSDKTRFASIVAAFALVLAACSETGPEARLQQALVEMESAIESRDAGDFVDWVTEDFVSADGQIDRRSLRALLASQMLGSESIEVILGRPTIKLFGERATIEVEALAMGGRYLPERGERLMITSGWRLEDGEWRCYTASWKRG
jgi:hypothetical protein